MAGPEREETRQLLKQWKNFRGRKRLPDQDDVSFDALAAFAPNLFVLDIEAEDRFIIKQAGETLRERFGGIDARGVNLLHVTEPAFRERLRARVRLIFEFGYAACTHTQAPATDGRLKRTENLMLPVENTAGGFRQIVGAIYYADGPDDTAHHTANLAGPKIMDESFIDLGSGYAAVIDANELPESVFPSNPEWDG